MPFYDPDRVEYAITIGHIQIVMDGGRQLPAYWAHPRRGSLFPGVALIHDWWGLDDSVRRMANMFAQVGFYVIAPDLFDGRRASTPQEAMELVRILGENGYPRIDAALSVLEKHHHCNGYVAAVGMGLGGSLAFEASIRRKDLEAAVSYYGFPQRYFGHFKDANTPILAFYGDGEPHVKPEMIEQLRAELAQSASQVSNQVMVIPTAARDFFSDSATAGNFQAGKMAWKTTIDFLEKHLTGKGVPEKKKTRT
jgi:carboxymethylenebutenolidase